MAVLFGKENDASLHSSTKKETRTDIQNRVGLGGRIIYEPIPNLKCINRASLPPGTYLSFDRELQDREG